MSGNVIMKKRWAYSLQEIADAAGLSIHTVRYHRRTGLLSPEDFVNVCSYVVSKRLIGETEEKPDA